MSNLVEKQKAILKYKEETGPQKIKPVGTLSIKDIEESQIIKHNLKPGQVTLMTKLLITE